MTTVSNKRKHPESLKRPDLQGEFKCGSCQELFQHASSLNRHRLLRHSSEIRCLLCDRYLTSDENVRSHMTFVHQSKSFTCSCCNWTFAEKRLLLQHTASIFDEGKPGTAEPVAVSIHEPGSLTQEMLLGRPKKEPRRSKKSLSQLKKDHVHRLESEKEILEKVFERLFGLKDELFQQIIEESREQDIETELTEVVREKRARIAEIGDSLARKVGIIQ